MRMRAPAHTRLVIRSARSDCKDEMLEIAGLHATDAPAESDGFPVSVMPCDPCGI